MRQKYKPATEKEVTKLLLAPTKESVKKLFNELEGRRYRTEHHNELYEEERALEKRLLDVPEMRAFAKLRKGLRDNTEKLFDEGRRLREEMLAGGLTEELRIKLLAFIKKVYAPPAEKKERKKRTYKPDIHDGRMI